jgi:threonine aldolase
MMAAAASAALVYTFPRLSAVHVMTRHAAQVLEAEGYEFALPVQMNMIVLDLGVVDLRHAAIVEYCREDEVADFPKGRLVFHHQTWEERILRLLKALRRLTSDKKAGVNLVDHKVIT